MPEPEADKAWYEDVVDWVKATYEWIQQNLGDPAISGMIRADLGLDPDADVETGQFDGWPPEDFDPDEAAFEETVAQVVAAVTAIVEFADAISDDAVSGWDVAYLIGRLAAHDTLRLRAPLLYAIANLTGFVTDDPEELAALEPDLLLTLLKGEEPPPGTGQRIFERLMAGSQMLLMAGEAVGDVLDFHAFEAYTGWDPDPGAVSEDAELASTRATTMAWVVGDDDASGRLMVTIVPVAEEHGGPGLLLAFGGGATVEHTDGDTTYRLTAGLPGALDLFIPWGGSPHEFRAGGHADSLVTLDVRRGKPGVPALRIGEPGGTRVDVEKLVVGLELGAERAAFRLGVEKATLVIALSQGDGFLAALPGAEIKVDFGLVLTVDTDGGLRVEGGTRAQATLPINASLFGVFTIQHLQVALGPSSGRDVALELSGAFSLDLGPFRASVDRIGILLDAGFEEGNLGFLDVAIGLKPPNGIGLALDAGPVKGGGYLYVDHERGEYAGVLELKIGPVGLKAIGIVTTRMPDGSDGWALLLLLFFELPPIQLGFGFTLNGVGGLFGLQHAVSIDALQAGLKDGVLDDVLFPEDPVGDAPRIINRLKTVFPVTPSALVFGPMFELGWGGAVKIMTVRLGVIVQLDNVIGGSGDIALNSVTVLGTVKVVVPHDDAAVVRLTVDLLGYYDVPNQRLGFTARLRDSKVMEALTLEGMLVLQIQFGDHASFVFAAGGFHPRFTDLPPDLPATIDRLAIKTSIEVVKLKIECYFAITPATVQVGLKASLSAKFGPVEIKGSLGFDAIFYFKPTFRFEIDLHLSVAVSFKGHNLMAVGVEMTLWGPSQWRAKGTVRFSILFWDIEKDFDTRSGSTTPALEGSTEVAALVAQQLADRGNWTAQLPAGGESVASLGPITGLESLLAHPLGSLGVTQRLAPLGLELERYGQTAVAGASRILVESVTIDGEEVPDRTPLREQFARSHFQEMSSEEKLTSPSFETFDAGVAVSTDAYVPAPTEVKADLSYETEILEPRPELPLGLLRPAFSAAAAAAATAAAGSLSAIHAHRLARHGAAGVAARLRGLREGVVDVAPVRVGPAPVTVVDGADLTLAAELDGAVSGSEALAVQAARSGDGLTVVESFEMVGA